MLVNYTQNVQSIVDHLLSLVSIEVCFHCTIQSSSLPLHYPASLSIFQRRAVFWLLMTASNALLPLFHHQRRNFVTLMHSSRLKPCSHLQRLTPYRYPSAGSECASRWVRCGLDSALTYFSLSLWSRPPCTCTVYRSEAVSRDFACLQTSFISICSSSPAWECLYLINYNEKRRQMCVTSVVPLSPDSVVNWRNDGK